MFIVKIDVPVVALVSALVCNPQVAGSNPVRDVQGYELIGEIALKNQQFF